MHAVCTIQPLLLWLSYLQNLQADIIVVQLAVAERNIPAATKEELPSAQDTTNHTALLMHRLEQGTSAWRIRLAKHAMPIMGIAGFMLSRLVPLLHSHIESKVLPVLQQEPLVDVCGLLKVAASAGTCTAASCSVAVQATNNNKPRGLKSRTLLSLLRQPQLPPSHLRW
jgi:hypothetical protein